ncbi:high frequency lysogenization protein HflD [Oceanobacter kriegii]|uniref:high frequency lysogenization protein HflD n=1 Tax=Oceanobacter kriegii TaxID=64972 RepID=UPI000429E4B4|nr:high frequency lysogenization protein HflD [Oceanobacter kriegii]
MTNREERAVAIAAVVQAATLVEKLASTGDAPAVDTDPLLESLFIQNPDSFADIYGNPKRNLHLGMNTLHTLASGKGNAINPDVTRYTVAILHLESKLRRNRGMMRELGNGIEQCGRQAEAFSTTHENTIAALADLYKNTLSNLSYRIHVTGNPTYLQNDATANKVRALLLAGIRAAILWRQVGGRRWQLLLGRKHYLNALGTLLEKD